MRRLLLFLIMLGCPPGAHSGDVYHEITTHLTATLPLTHEKEVEPQEDRIHFATPHLSMHERISIAGQLLHSHALSTPTDAASLPTLPEEAIHDLQLFGSQARGSTSVLQLIDRTQSTFGRLVLARFLVQPHTDITKLQQRQRAVQFLLEHPSLANQLRELVTAFAEQEEALLSLWNTRDLLYGKNIRNAFYQGNFDNGHTASSLERKRIIDDISLPLSPILFYILGKIMVHVGVDGASIIKTAFKQEEDGSASTNWMIQTGFPIIFTLLMTMSDGRRQLTQFLNRMAVVTHLRTRLSALVRYAHLISMLTNVLRAEPAFAELLPGITPLLHSQTDEQTKFVELLQSESFTKTTYFTTIGPVLAALPHFLQLRHTFGAALEAIGTLDAHLSLATLYTERQNKQATYCFPRYEQQTTPLLRLDGVWHPLFGEGAVQKNDAYFGGEAHPYMIITGPNAAGKSTYLKTVMIAALMAQTLGIMPAQEAIFTPFTHLITYLNVIDDVGKQQSLFRAEVDRAYAMLQTLHGLQPGQHALIGLDEIFCSTNWRVGQATAYALTHLLRQQPNTLGLIATHFPKVPQLADKHPATYRNMHFIGHKQPDGSYDYPYTIQSGASTQMIALDLLKYEEFDEKLLAYAYEHLSQGILVL